MTEQLNSRILAIDYGEKRVGLAITDPLCIFGYPLATLQNDKNFWNNLMDFFIQYSIKKIIIGYPLKESGEKTHITDAVIKFRDDLSKRVNAAIEFVDERYSSSIAAENIIQSVASKKKRRDKGLLDRNAAAVLLQDYLRDTSA